MSPLAEDSSEAAGGRRRRHDRAARPRRFRRPPAAPRRGPLRAQEGTGRSGARDAPAREAVRPGEAAARRLAATSPGAGHRAGRGRRSGRHRCHRRHGAPVSRGPRPPYPVLPRGAAGQDRRQRGRRRGGRHRLPRRQDAPRGGAHPAGLLPNGCSRPPCWRRCPRTPSFHWGTTSTRRAAERLPGVVRQDLGAVPGHHLPGAGQPRVRHAGAAAYFAYFGAAPASPARATTATTSAPGTSSR